MRPNTGIVPSPARSKAAFWDGVLPPLAIAVAALGIAGCRQGPDAPPEVAAPAAGSLLVSKGGGVDTALPADERWWTRLGDARLDDLIARAEKGNQSLAAALASVRGAYAGLGVTKGDLWPNFGFGAQYQRTLTNIAQLASTGVNVEPYNMYAYGIGMSSWEIDLWGGVRRRVESAEASARGQVEALREALISVRAQVVACDLQLRTLQARREVLVRNLASLAGTRDAVKAKYESGTATKLDLSRVVAQYDAVDAQLPSIDAAIASAAASLAVLCGEAPSNFAPFVAEAAALPSIPEVVGIGLPADILERRPDVRAARQALAAATAQIGAAEAARLPTISISGNFYIASNTVSGLGDLQNKAYAIGPSLYLPIFTAGALENASKQAKAAAEGALAQYQGAVISAVGDLSASVSDFVFARDSLARSLAARASAEETLALARQRLDAGVIDLTTYLDVERETLQAESDAVDAEATLAQSFVSLNLALGGGWRDADADRAAEGVASDAGDRSMRASAAKEADSHDMKPHDMKPHDMKSNDVQPNDMGASRSGTHESNARPSTAPEALSPGSGSQEPKP